MSDTSEPLQDEQGRDGDDPGDDEGQRDRNQVIRVIGYRLPGWTGGEGFYLGDGQTFVWARGNEQLKAPPLWQPVLVQGRWLSDSFGTAWLQVEEVIKMSEGG